MCLRGQQQQGQRSEKVTAIRMWTGKNFVSAGKQLMGTAMLWMLPKDQAADAFAFLEPDIQQHIINSITDAEVSKIIEDLFVDDAVDMLEEQDISKLVLQWDRAPKSFKIQISEDGSVWKDLQTVDGESVNTITFAQPIHTRYIKMQGVSLNGNNTFKLREFEAYEAVDKTALKEQVKAAEEKCEEFGLTFADAKGYDAFMDAYMKAEAMYENTLAEQNDVDLATKTLEETLKDLPENPEPGEVEVESVKVTVNKTELKVGETTTAKAVITPDNATDQTVSWTTSDESVITVDKDGQITAKKIGKANVIATASNGKTDKVYVPFQRTELFCLYRVGFTHSQKECV